MERKLSEQQLADALCFLISDRQYSFRSAINQAGMEQIGTLPKASIFRHVQEKRAGFNLEISQKKYKVFITLEEENPEEE